MTDRKPHDISIETWVDRQIRSAQEAGAFENLPGAGKPIPASSTDELAWVRGYLRRENLPSDALLPTPLRLRKEIENLRDTVAGLRTEDAVRAHHGLPAHPGRAGDSGVAGRRRRRCRAVASRPGRAGPR
jgi:hypothetical protein